MVLCLDVRRLAAESPTGEEERYRFRFTRQEVLIGRGEGMDVLLPDAAVSLVHARLVVEAGQWMVVDEGSTNGTSLDGVALARHDPRPLPTGSLLRVGPFAIDVLPRCDDLAPVQDERAQTAELARRMVRDVLMNLDQHEPFFEVLSGPTKGARATISAAGATIGRDAECALALPDKDASRHHARAERVGAAVELTDLGSKNGVFVDEERIEGSHRLQHLDVVRVGSTKLRFCDPAQALLVELQAPRADEQNAVPSEVEERSEVMPVDGIGEEAEWTHASLSELSNAPSAAAPTQAASGPAPFERLLFFGIGGLLVAAAVFAALVLLL